MTAAPHLNCLPDGLLLPSWPGRLADRISERQQVVARGGQVRGVGAEPDDLPATRGAQPFGMEFAQVIGVRFG